MVLLFLILGRAQWRPRNGGCIIKWTMASGRAGGSGLDAGPVEALDTQGWKPPPSFLSTPGCCCVWVLGV